MIKKILIYLAGHYITPFLDCVFKQNDRLNPMFASRDLRVVGLLEGKPSHNTGRAAAFVLYQKENIPFYVKNAIEALEETQVDCWISINDDASEEMIDYLKKNTHKVMVRKNFGRDFCAYKDLFDEIDLNALNRLIVLNDSVFYYKKNLTCFFNRLLNEEKDVISVTSSLALEWHIQSYLFSLSRKVFLSKDFNHFWKSYKPYNSRVHAIYQGELAFSREVLEQHKSNSESIYNLPEAVASLRSLSSEDSFYLLPDFSKEKKRVSKKYIVLGEQNNLELLKRIEDLNHSHGIALLCSSHLGFCVLKKDIAFRGSFSYSGVAMALSILGIDDAEIKESLIELQNKGKRTHLNFKNTFLAKLGFV